MNVLGTIIEFITEAEYNSLFPVNPDDASKIIPGGGYNVLTGDFSIIFWSLIILAAVSIISLIIFRQSCKVYAYASNANINVFGRCFPLKKLISIILAAATAIFLALSIFFGLSVSLNAQSQFEYPEKVYAVVDEDGNIIVEDGYIKNNGDEIVIKKSSLSSNIETNDINLKVTVGDDEIYNGRANDSFEDSWNHVFEKDKKEVVKYFIDVDSKAALNFAENNATFNLDLEPVLEKGSFTLTLDEGTFLDGSKSKAIDYVVGDKWGDRLETVTRAGYDFVKWIDNDGNEVTNQTVMNPNKFDIKPVWEEQEKIISLNAGEGYLPGLVKTKDFKVKIGERFDAFGDLPVPELAGKDFIGWYDSNQNIIYNSTIVTVDNINLTALYAKALDPLCFTAINNDSSIGGFVGEGCKLIYSVDDKNTWSEWNGSTVSLNANEKLYIRAADNIENNADLRNYKNSGIGRFEMNGDFAASGNVDSLLNAYKEVDLKDNCFNNLFLNCIGLLSAPELPSEKLAKDCYSNMFSGCMDLQKAPDLPAMELAENCYRFMFSNCANLNQAPVLNATKLAPGCYESMFASCCKLEIAPNLPATELTEKCYKNMFTDCSELTKAPILHAQVLTEKCYEEMFSLCKKLHLVDMYATDVSAEDCLNSWLTDAGTDAGAAGVGGVVYVNAGMEMPVKAYCPGTWTVI